MSGSTVEQIKASFGSSLGDLLENLSEQIDGLLAAQVCTSDGFEVVSVHRNEESHRRLAAMVSSLHALGSAMVEETDLGEYVNLMIEATAGKCLMMAIPDTGGQFLLAAITKPTVLFGMFHNTCKRTAELMGEALEADSAA